MTVDEWWAKLKESGWLSEIPKVEATRIRQQVESEWAERLPDAFNALARDVLDGECINDKGDYVKVVKAYSRVSGGVFVPKKLKDAFDWDNERVTVTFDLNGEEFECGMSLQDDYIHENFHDYMNEVVEACNTEKRFFQLPTDDQCFGLVFVTPATYAKAHALGLIPSQEDYAD